MPNKKDLNISSDAVASALFLKLSPYRNKKVQYNVLVKNCIVIGKTFFLKGTALTKNSKKAKWKVSVIVQKLLAWKT